jgi:hypothetical protein
MTKHGLIGIGFVVALTLFAGDLSGRSEICLLSDMKPVLSLQQINQAELVHYLVVIAGLRPPSPEGKTPEEFYAEEVKMLTDAGYPAVFTEVEPDRIVTRRYFASVMYILATMVDKEFANKHGGLTDETAQLNALIESEWLYAEEERIYREEILSILCSRDISPPEKPAADYEIWPEIIQEANLESMISPL